MKFKAQMHLRPGGVGGGGGKGGEGGELERGGGENFVTYCHGGGGNFF